MRYQSTPARCGPTSLGEALAALGYRRHDDELAKLCETDVDGTDTRGMLKGALLLKESCDLVGPVKIEERKGDVALLRLDKLLSKGRPAVLLVDDWSHYVAVVGRLGEKFIVADPADDERIQYRDLAGLDERWKCNINPATKKEPRCPYWAMVI